MNSSLTNNSLEFKTSEKARAPIWPAFLGQRSKRMRSARNQLFLEHEKSEHKQHPRERRFESAFQNADSTFANWA